MTGKIDDMKPHFDVLLDILGKTKYVDSTEFLENR